MRPAKHRLVRHIASCDQLIRDTSPTVLFIWIVQQIAQAAHKVGLDCLVVTAGASSDSQVLNRVVPVGTLPVPNRAGVRRDAEEWTDVTAAADVTVAGAGWP